jgi:hypothetical protein
LDAKPISGGVRFFSLFVYCSLLFFAFYSLLSLITRERRERKIEKMDFLSFFPKTWFLALERLAFLSLFFVGRKRLTARAALSLSLVINKKNFAL